MASKRFVLDANTIISAFLLSETSVAAKAYYKARSEGEIILSNEVFLEFSEVFVRPKFDKYLSLDKRLMIIDDIEDIANFIEVNHYIAVCRDPKDDKYLDLAVEGGADCIITGDKDLLVLNPFRSIQIVKASEFLHI